MPCTHGGTIKSGLNEHTNMCVDCGELFFAHPDIAIESATGTAHLCPPHTHPWQGVFVIQMAVLIYEQTQLVTNSCAPFGLWTVRESVCNPTVYSTARSNLVNYKFNV